MIEGKLANGVVDPESSQADKLRRLLNVVSGRAPDANGRISEPLVKEELAIVEFLTAKSNSAPNSNPGSLPRETPVDLLLGLAKTRSGRRAAEEEKRQLRQQAAREQQEQSAPAPGSSGQQQRGGQGMSSSPWGYKPPSMPGLDVVQPFDMAGQRRDGPRPLQPPVPKRGSNGVPQNNWSPEFNMNTGEMKRPSSSSSYKPSPENMFNSPNLSQQQQQQHPNFNLSSLTNTSDHMSQNGSGSQNGYQLSPYQQIIPLASPQAMNMGPGSDPFAGAGSLEQFFAANNLAQGSSDSGPQFGHAVLDQFDFTNLGLDLENGPVNLGGNGGFNPFALPQTEAEG